MLIIYAISFALHVSPHLLCYVYVGSVGGRLLNAFAYTHSPLARHFRIFLADARIYKALPRIYKCATLDTKIQLCLQ